MLRTTASLSATIVCIGINSQMSRPGTLVATGANWPRNSAGASGFMSYLSRWLGPPGRQIRITDLGDGPAGAAWLRRRSTSANERLASPQMPARRKRRRLLTLLDGAWSDRFSMIVRYDTVQHAY